MGPSIKYAAAKICKGQPGQFATALDEIVEGKPRDGIAAVAGKDVRRFVRPLAEPSLQGSGFIGLDEMLATEGAFDPVHSHLQAFEIQVSNLQ